MYHEVWTIMKLGLIHIIMKLSPEAELTECPSPVLNWRVSIKFLLDVEIANPMPIIEKCYYNDVLRESLF